RRFLPGCGVRFRPLCANLLLKEGSKQLALRRWPGGSAAHQPLTSFRKTRGPVVARLPYEAEFHSRAGGTRFQFGVHIANQNLARVQKIMQVVGDFPDEMVLKNLALTGLK